MDGLAKIDASKTRGDFGKAPFQPMKRTKDVRCRLLSREPKIDFSSCSLRIKMM